MLLLDTNVISGLRRLDRADANLRAWSETNMGSDAYLSAVTIMEVEMGALKMARRDATQAAVLRQWIDGQVLPSFDGKILPVDADVALRCARLHVPDPRPERDAFIAATALVHGLTVVTRNTRDFEPMGVTTINPWEPQP